MDQKTIRQSVETVSIKDGKTSGERVDIVASNVNGNIKGKMRVEKVSPTGHQTMEKDLDANDVKRVVAGKLPLKVMDAVKDNAVVPKPEVSVAPVTTLLNKPAVPAKKPAVSANNKTKTPGSASASKKSKTPGSASASKKPAAKKPAAKKTAAKKTAAKKSSVSGKKSGGSATKKSKTPGSGTKKSKTPKSAATKKSKTPKSVVSKKSKTPKSATKKSNLSRSASMLSKTQE
jgi:hypothetical protein